MTKDTSTSIETVNQNHSGPGDNVGEKHVYQAIPSVAIQPPVEDILTYLRHRNHKTASDKLKTLGSTSQLNTQARAVLEVLSVLVQIAKGSDVAHGYKAVDSCLQSQPDQFYEDIANSTKLRLDIINERIDDAGKFYQSLKNPGLYSQEVFYEFIAQVSELEDILEHIAHELTEIPLCGLTRGLIRCGNYANAVISGERLLTKYPCFNSKVIDLIARCSNSAKQLSVRHFWVITASERKQTLSLADESINLLEECEAKDTRAVNQALGFLRFLSDSHIPLVDACWKYHKDIEDVDKKLANFLRSLREKDIGKLKGLPYEIEKANTDFSYKESLVTRLSNSQELSSEDLILFGHVADSVTVQEWLDKGGNVLSEDEFEKQFNMIELLCYANDNSAKATNALKKSADTFICTHRDKLSSLNPPRLHDLTAMLLDADLAPQVCALLQPIIPTKDIWLSPIVKNYINALLGSQQLATLNSILSEINQADWGEFIWQIKARQFEYQNNFVEAILAIEKALELSPKSLVIWHYLIRLLKCNNTDPQSYKGYLNKIPKEVFYHQNNLSLQLLLELSSNGYYEIVDRTLVNWFVDDPINSAKPITDFHFNESSIEQKKSARPVLSATENCLGGYHYTQDGSDITKVVVTGLEPKHSSIIRSSSPLAQQLLKMKINETVQYGAYDLTLLEKLPPYVVVLRLSLEIRQTSNDGSDCFYQFTLPEDPEEMVASLEKKMLAFKSNDKKEEFYSNPSYPLFLKGHMLGDRCPVHSALSHLTSKQSVKPPLPNIGVERPDSIILDIYSVAYLGLTGLIHGLENTKTKIVITIETEAYLKQFLEDVNHDDYMRMDVNSEGKLWRTTADDIKKGTADLQSAIRHILEKSTITRPNLVDIPPDIIQIQRCVDPSVFSSLTLSIANNIPWLCIDETFAQLSHKSNYPVVNAIKFLTAVGFDLNIEKKLPGLYLHVSAGLPYPLTFEELLQMSNVGDDSAHYFLSKILQMYPNAYADTDLAIEQVHRIIIVALAKACVDGEIFNGLRKVNPSNNGYTERLFNICCYVIIQKQDGEEAELKLAKLFCAIFITAKDNSVIYKLVYLLGSRFISGHFLNLDAINQHIRELLPEETIFE